jgi:hypothetical protein
MQRVFDAFSRQRHTSVKSQLNARYAYSSSMRHQKLYYILRGPVEVVLYYLLSPSPLSVIYYLLSTTVLNCIYRTDCTWYTLFRGAVFIHQRVLQHERVLIQWRAV